MIVALIILGALVAVGLPLYLLNRYQEKHSSECPDGTADGATDDAAVNGVAAASSANKAVGQADSSVNNPEGGYSAEDAKDIDSEVCCGMHITCEKDSLLADVSDTIDYFDDEELDRYAGRGADSYTAEEVEEFRDVLLTLIPEDIAPWARSIQLRGINLPSEVRDELLMIVAEARKALE